MPTVESIVKLTKLRSMQMNEVDKLNAQIAELMTKRDSEIHKEKTNVLAKMKADIKLYGFKTKDFKGVLLTRAKRGTGTAAKKTSK
jgi:hypothetical protein